MKAAQRENCAALLLREKAPTAVRVRDQRTRFIFGSPLGVATLESRADGQEPAILGIDVQVADQAAGLGRGCRRRRAVGSGAPLRWVSPGTVARSEPVAGR